MSKKPDTQPETLRRTQVSNDENRFWIGNYGLPNFTQVQIEPYNKATGGRSKDAG